MKPFLTTTPSPVTALHQLGALGGVVASPFLFSFAVRWSCAFILQFKVSSLPDLSNTLYT